MIDVVVIGGGIAGVSAAARLSADGSVLLVEAEDHLAHHASGRSAALFEATYGHPVNTVLSAAGADEFHERGVLAPRGLMVVGEADDPAFDHDMRAMRMHPLTAGEATAMVPVLDLSGGRRAGHHAEAWDIDTHALIQQFAREARANGAEIRTKARVTGIAREAGGWRVEAGGTVRARTLVNAAGAWADEVARMAGVRPLGLVPRRRSMARVPAPGGHDVSGWPMILGAGETWYARPDAGALLISPADAEPSHPHDAWPDDMVLAEGIARYQAFATEEVTRLVASWAGLRTFAPDRALVIGRDPVEPEFVWVAGQGGSGFQTSVAASLLVADLVAGRTPGLDAATVARLSPGRFAPGAA